MSIAIMTYVWANSKQEGGALLLELALADYANDAGRSFPSLGSLALKTRLTERHVRRLLRQLEKDGEIQAQPCAGPHGCNVYQFLQGGQNVPPSRGTPMSGGGTSETRRGGHLKQGGGTPMSPDPSIEPSLESKIPTQQQEMFQALADATKLDPALKQNAGRIGKVASELVKAEYLPAHVTRAYLGDNCWWRRNDWRGKKGQPPTPDQIIATIGEAVKKNGKAVELDPDRVTKLRFIQDNPHNPLTAEFKLELGIQGE